jgi:peroxiredoxin
LGSLIDDIDEAGGTVVAVAVTATFSQMAFSESLAAPFPLLSDWSGEVCGAYGVRYDQWKGHAGVAKRSVFVIDPRGIIRYSWSTDQAEETPDFAEPIRALRAIRNG